jgi:hypothetical protein
MTFAVPGRKFVDPNIEKEARALEGRRNVRMASFLGAFVLMGTITGTAYAWFRSQNDPKGALLSYLPDPIEREIAPDNKPLPPVGKPLKLADFDKLHPEKAFNPNPNPNPTTDPPPKKVPVTVEKDPAPAPVVKKQPSDCYDTTPKGKVGYLTVGASSAVRVEIDGKRVCVNATKLAVAAGTHKLKVTEVKSKLEDVSNLRIEAGKSVKITPVFKK